MLHTSTPSATLTESVAERYRSILPESHPNHSVARGAIRDLALWAAPWGRRHVSPGLPPSAPSAKLTESLAELYRNILPESHPKCCLPRGVVHDMASGSPWGGPPAATASAQRIVFTSIVSTSHKSLSEERYIVKSSICHTFVFS